MKPGSPNTENVKMISSVSDQQDEQPIDYQYGYSMTDDASNSTSDSYSIVSLSPEVDHSLQTIINEANESNGRLTTSSPESPMQAIQVDLTPRTKVGFEREAAWLREQLDRAQRDLAASINQNLLLHFRIQRLQTQLVDEHKERNEQEALLQEAQQKAYSLLDHATWESDTEKTIRRLDQFGKHIQQWCKQYSVKLALHEVADTEAVRKVLGRLIPVGKDANSFNEMGLKSTGMVLQACLTDYLFRMTIENPFYFFDSRMQVDVNTLTNQTANEGMLSKELVGTYFDAFSCE
ncbi:hypothetical protein BGW36DRAFT_435893 [Talaromyces proteolyticus]|uniref:Uncharacterized protein n=1 Tax=Talaromyces proteolyticus TaxID=1131652 RepID=A0AAD4Q467_9EURO|nr:uncharacterized protein BGW36DRAFT_435893 [Talaromyces proteolyticus]KAH8705849.1 hypothetical protein BGW36DRAFT_435893 [Talaromyces proteolyticus]